MNFWPTEIHIRWKVADGVCFFGQSGSKVVTNRSRWVQSSENVARLAGPPLWQADSSTTLHQLLWNLGLAGVKKELLLCAVAMFGLLWLNLLTTHINTEWKNRYAMLHNVSITFKCISYHLKNDLHIRYVTEMYCKKHDLMYIIIQYVHNSSLVMFGRGHVDQFMCYTRPIHWSL